MGSQSTQIITLANSIIGVGILAMPFCFERCGIILSILLLVMSNLITRFCCYYLLKSSILTRRKNFEHLGFHAFGASGKLLVELCVIGYLIGTCIAYFVVVGDLGPQIISKVFSITETPSLRYWVMIILTIVCIAPLAMLKNVDSLASVCTASIGFYICLVLKVISESSTNFSTQFDTQKLVFWQPSGVLQCLPIFSMALSCQMQIFEVYETMGGASLSRMNEVIKYATNICTSVYIFIGFFGYVAFSNQNLSGNIIMNFTPSFASDIIKTGFVLSVACSFPLAIFPCRVSLYSLIYKRNFSEASYIPEAKFKPLTMVIVIASLVMGILIPSIELVIGLVGSTIGVAICIIFPAACYVKICQKDTSEKFVAQIMIAFGFILMILGTYANLNAIDKVKSRQEIEIVNVPDTTNGKIADVFAENLVNLERNKFDNVIEIKLDDKGEMKIANKEKHEPVVEEVKVNPLPVEQIQVIVPPTDDKNKAKDKDKQSEDAEIEKPDTKVHEILLVDKQDEVKEVINNDALLKEDQEIAVEAGENLKEAEKKQVKLSDDNNIVKEAIKQQVENMQKEFAKKTEETQKILLQKIEEIGVKVDKININNDDLNSAKLDTKSNIKPNAEEVKLPERKEELNTANPETIAQEVNNELGSNVNKMDPIVKLLTEKAKISNISKPIPASDAETQVVKDQLDLLKYDILSSFHSHANDSGNALKEQSNQAENSNVDQKAELNKVQEAEQTRKDLEAAEQAKKKEETEKFIKKEAERIAKERIAEIERLEKEKLEKEKEKEKAVENERLSHNRDILQVNSDPVESLSNHESVARRKRNLEIDNDCAKPADGLDELHPNLLQENEINFIKNDILQLPLHDLKSVHKK